MKKFLLFVVAAAFTVNASAQFKAAEKVSQPKATVSSARLEAIKAKAVSPSPRKTLANGVVYSRPQGTFWLTYDKEGLGYTKSFLLVPPFTDISFQNISTAKGDTVWTINGKEYPAEEDGSFDFGSLPIQNPYNAPGGVTYYPMPTLTIAETAFTLQGVGSTKNANYSSESSGIVVDTLNAMTLYDSHNTTYYGWGVMYPTPYLYGSGTRGSATGGKCVGVFQDYPKPAAPLYIQDAYASCLSNLEVPIPEGKELSLVFVELDDEGNETENILGTMTATSASVTWDKKDGEYDKLVDEEFTTGEGFQGQIVFEQKEVDYIGNETVTPVIVNTPFRVYLLGLDEDGVDIGFSGRLAGDEAAVGDSYFMIQEGTEISNFHYTSSVISLPFNFTAMYDVAMLQDSDTGEYTAPTEGGTVTRADNAEYDVAYVYTAYPWYDNLGNENYFVYVEYPEGDPEWITTTIDDSYYNKTDSNDDYYGVTMIGMEAEALPEGVEGRYATVYVYGPAAEVSFVVKQGEVTAIKGVTVKDENSKFAGATYNLAGQKVGADYKGIVIENGKKVVKK